MIKTILIYSPFVVALMTFGLFCCTVSMGTRAKSIALMVLLLCAAKFICFEAFGGDPFAPQLPASVIWIWNWAYSTLIILFFLTVPCLLVRLLVRGVLKVDCPSVVWLIALPLVAGLLAVWGCVNGARLPEVEEVELSFDNLPAELDGYRVLQLSDIHASASAPRERTAEIVARANAVGADLICLTGDYFDGLAKNQFRNVAPLKDLRAKDGVLAVTGNHEYYFDTFNWMERFSTLTNITFLTNACVSPREGLVVGGVRDSTGHLQGGFPPPDPDEAFASATNGAFRILLQHRPYVRYEAFLDRTPSAKVDLQLSGHTHGGIVPGLSLLVSVHNNGFVRGVYEGADGRKVHVSAGVSQWAGFPLRYLNDPKMTVITLRRKDSRE